MGENEVWIGMVQVIPMPGNTVLKGAKGAYLNVIAMASSEVEFSALVADELLRDHMYVMNVEDAEPFEDRAKHHTVVEEIEELVDQARMTGEIGIATLYTYEEDAALI